MSRPIPRPRGCSEAGHVGYGPLTADRVAPVAAASQPSSHRVSAPVLEVLANDHCRTDAQVERTLPLPSENARSYHPVQVDATRCGVVVFRNTHTHIG